MAPLCAPHADLCQNLLRAGTSCGHGRFKWTYNSTTSWLYINIIPCITVSWAKNVGKSWTLTWKIIEFRKCSAKQCQVFSMIYTSVSHVWWPEGNMIPLRPGRSVTPKNKEILRSLIRNRNRMIYPSRKPDFIPAIFYISFYVWLCKVILFNFRNPWVLQNFLNSSSNLQSGTP